jgi:hypothetical protein
MTLALQKQIKAARLKSEDYLRLYRAVGATKAPLLAGAMDAHYRKVLAPLGLSALDLEKVVAELHRQFADEWCDRFLELPGLLTPEMKPWIEDRLNHTFFGRTSFVGTERQYTPLFEEIVRSTREEC